MIERFLFDRIDTKTGTATIGRQDHLPSVIFPDKTKAPIARFQLAFTRAQITQDPSRFFDLMPPTSGKQPVRIHCGIGGRADDA